MRADVGVRLRAVLWVLGGAAATLIGGSVAPAGAGALCLPALPCTPGAAEAGEDPAASPDPGGDETAAVAVPPPGGRLFGVHQPLWETSPYRVGADSTAEIARRAGANALRFGIPWLTVEPAPDRWDEGAWQRYGRMYAALTARGMTPLITVGFAPAWAREPGSAQLCLTERGCEYPPAPSMDGEWREFVAEVATRFPLAAIEIWNEPNLVNYWKPQPSPERYAELVAQAEAAISAVNPAATVVGASLSPAARTATDALGRPTALAAREFLDRAYRASPGIGGRLDAISLHTTFQELRYGADTIYAEVFENVREIRDAHGEPTLPLWITETGLTLTGPYAIGPQQQADGLERQYRRAMTMPDVEAIFLHTLLDRYEVVGSRDPARGFGIVEAPDPFAPRPAYCRFASAAGTPAALSRCPPP